MAMLDDPPSIWACLRTFGDDTALRIIGFFVSEVRLLVFAELRMLPDDESARRP